MDPIASLKRNTEELLHLFDGRVQKIRNREAFSLLVRRLDESKAKRTLAKLLGEGEFVAVGIDGSMDQVESLEMLLFYVNAIGYRCAFTVSNGEVNFDMRHVVRDSKLGSTSAVPLWLEDCSTVAGQEGPRESEVEHMAALMNISFSLMLMAELTSAMKAFENRGLKLLFLDRPLSGSYHTLARDVRNLLLKGSTPLSKIYPGDIRRDLSMALSVPFEGAPKATHGPYRVHAAMEMLAEGATFQQVVEWMGLDPQGADRLLRALLKRGQMYDILEGDEGHMKVREELGGYRERLRQLALQVSDRLFLGTEHPLRVDGEWLTTTELNVVNYVLLGSLVERARERGVLLVGLTKDTNSSDISRSLMELCGVPQEINPGMRHDRVMLSVVSVTNSTICRPPWRSVGYDSCFSTLTKNDEDVGGTTPKLRAARKVATREKLFVRFFFQSRASSRTQYRSPVFLLDRPYDPRYDDGFEEEVEYVEKGRVERMKPYLELSGVNELDNAVLYLLSKSDNPEVFEAYGHNMLLYLADKAVKADVKMMRGTLQGLVNLELTPLARREKLFSIVRRWRDSRSEMESARSSASTPYDFKPE
jgi:hypothetical protein